MHLRGNVIYNTWENFWKKAYKSSYFRAQYDETSERTDWSLSERQLFTQSNGIPLLGQYTMGSLHFSWKNEILSGAGQWSDDLRCK